MKRNPSTRPAGRLAAARERGTAYLVALLALVVLTIVGLALAFITQTENQLAANERTLQRVFYAADSGISLSIARALTNRDTTGRTVTIAEPGVSAFVQTEEQVETSPFYPLLDSPCNLCELNNAGEYTDHAFRNTTYAMASMASRKGLADEVLAHKVLATMVGVQPQRSATEDYIPISDEEQLKKVRY